jgi:DNA-binding transcriptional LysR family regulator
MDLKRLRTFVAIAELGTVLKAAEQLHLTQPALSRQLQELQQELGFNLFDHVGRRLVLTAEGEQLLDNSRELLAHARSFGERALSLRQGDKGMLRVAASPVQIEAVLTTFLHRYTQKYPDVTVKLIEAVGPDIRAMLERGDIHVGLLLQADSAGAGHVAGYPVPPVELLAACHPSFPLVRGKAVEIGQLASHPLLLLDTGFLVRRTFDVACRLAGVKPDIRLESRAPSNLLSLAEGKHGVAIVPTVVLTHRYDLRTARLMHDRKPLREPLTVVWDQRRLQPRYARDFTQMLAVHMQTLLRRNRS